MLKINVAKWNNSRQALVHIHKAKSRPEATR